MCTVSNVGDHFTDRWKQFPINPQPQPFTNTLNPVNRWEFEALKAEVEECKQLLIAAKKIDAALGTPDCEQDEKLELIRKIAELVGVDLSEVIG